MQLFKLSCLATLLLPNIVLAESYQSFTHLSYSQNKSSFNASEYNYSSKGNSDNFSLSSRYYFDERQSLGPLNEFDYINTSSTISIFSSNRNSEYFAVNNDNNFNSDYSNNKVGVSGEWITNSFILGGSYSYNKSRRDYNEFSYDDSGNDLSVKLGYLFTDNFVIQAGYLEDEDGEDTFSYSARYNLQLADTDYIGFTYGVDDSFDVHQLSSQYFFGIAEQSYLVLGGSYTLNNRDNAFSKDYWSINGSYYYDDKTSVSVTYADNDFYSVGVRYFIDNNYSIQAGYNSVSGDKNQSEYEGGHFSFSAQF
ncbi:putative porin [Colwellia sp. 12G3]|uniref:putative porin n=1 Tax=Colwellia sp. 12G3 TaxID=2058299 RepID=UPI0012FEDEE3|nr:putative porin [Colwellia sp. 12G3]